MNLQVHRLCGCNPRPLASYLKAIAVFRLVAEQKDRRARGFWRDDAFHLATELDEDDLQRFFLEEWQPTPLVSPWNKGSGFFNPADKGLAPLRKSVASRLGPMRDGIAAAERLVEEMAAAVAGLKAIKAESNAIKDAAARDAFRDEPVYKQRLARGDRDCKRLKDDLTAACQRQWRGGALRWLRAAVVLNGDRAEFPALLGTGGVDGKLEFTNNAYQRLGDLFDLASADGAARPGVAGLLRSALWGEPVTGRRQGGIGQFSPAASGGANATSGPLAESVLNPWDLPLLLEGSVLFSASSTRRLASRGRGQVAAPFAVRGVASGYGSASAADDAQGTRGEQWMPLWDRPWTIEELSSMLAEGRCQIGPRSGESSADVARAVARLGVARGVSSFERFGYLTRNGKSNYAVPLGRWEVHPEPRGLLLDDLDRNDWWSRIRRAARDEHAPASFVRAERVLADAVLAALSNGAQQARWTSVLLAMADIEAQLVRCGAFTVKARLAPLPPLSASWIAALEDGAELRLALALAGSAASFTGRKTDSVRGHWLPLDRTGTRFQTRDKALAKDCRVVCAGRDPENDLIALVERRLIQANAPRTLPLHAHSGFSARPSDLAAMVAGAVDFNRTMWLARGLAALDWSRVGDEHWNLLATESEEPEPAYLALRLAHLPFALPRGTGTVAIPVDPSPIRLLAAGEPSRAFAVVRRRLQAASIRVPFQAATVDARGGRRYAASLAFPISVKTASQFARLLDPESHEELPHVR